jgi:aminocarboxymuconate-semialdehyde decarboxylase
MDRFGDYTQILTPVPALHLAIAVTNPKLASELVRLSNDGMAELVIKHPDRFRGFAALLPMHDSEKALLELERVLKMGALGVQVETNIGGVPLDNPRFEPFFARMAAANRPIWIHPFRVPAMPDYAAEKMSRYGMSQALGWPYETAVTLSRLIFSGLLERFPTLRIIGHHGGGMIPHFSGRLGRYLEVWGPRIDPDLEAALPGLKKPLLEYFRRFYVDTALNGAKHAVECVVDFFGPTHVLFGTDTPFDPAPGEFVRETIADVEALNLNESAKNAIFRRNALQLLGLAGNSE